MGTVGISEVKTIWKAKAEELLEPEICCQCG